MIEATDTKLSRGVVVAIDGPAGAGKSTLSTQLAEALGYLYIDTGAMYRAVAYLVDRNGLDPQDESALEALCRDISIELKQSGAGLEVVAMGEDVTSRIRTPEISMLTSKVAASPAVRTAMVRLQRRMGEAGGVVLEGRDIGTVVFPDAEVKFFLSATAEERGRRRYRELLEKGYPADLEETIAAVKERDRLDMERTASPLKQAPDAIVVDSTAMTIGEVLKLMQHRVEECHNKMRA